MLDGIDLKKLKLVTGILTICTLVLLSVFLYLLFTDEEKVVLPGERSGGECTDTPQLTEYKAVPYEGEMAPEVDFSSNPDALASKSSITEWFARGVQSGGKYAVAEWVCVSIKSGVACQDHAIIDVSDGRITAYGLPSSHGVGYRSDSNLLIINPSWNVTSDPYFSATTSTEFYELKEGVPVLICKITHVPKPKGE